MTHELVCDRRLTDDEIKKIWIEAFVKRNIGISDNSFHRSENETRFLLENWHIGTVEFLKSKGFRNC